MYNMLTAQSAKVQKYIRFGGPPFCSGGTTSTLLTGILQHVGKFGKMLFQNLPQVRDLRYSTETAQSTKYM